MEVTRANFRHVLPELNEVIDKAAFVAIDCELTGISTENNIYPCDRPEDAYRKINENSSGYILIQLGLTAVRASDEDPEKYSYRSYNFYVFPRLWKQSFKCQGSSMTFLAENGFDFVKLFRDGIPYCNQQQERELRERLEEKQKARGHILNCSEKDTSNHVPVPEDEKETLANIRKLVDEFLSSETETEKIINDCNGFQRKLIYEMLESDYSDKITASSRVENSFKVLVIEKKKSAEEELTIEQERRRNEQIELEESIGISAVMQKISKSGKLIVGHNMLLDLMHILRQCFGPLPTCFKEFKQYAHCIFPNIVDTKYVCTLPDIKCKIRNSILAHLVQTVSEEPFTPIKLEPECEDSKYSLSENKAHEAGYDSFLTATAFLGLMGHLKILPQSLANNNDKTRSFVNKIFLMRLQDVCYINLVGLEPKTSRDHVFHVTVPEVWRQSDLVNHFRSYGPIFVTWINQSSALISLQHRENSSIVLKTIGSYPGFKVQSLADFEESLEKRLHVNEDSVNPRKRKLESLTTPSEATTSKLNKRTKKKRKEKKDKTKVFDEVDDWS
uniref:Poly(A)-specific ribonuclease PARN n=1 Tax=Tabanus bromius TaxID=304241 RepID=A0A0K8TML4_TABBR